MRFLLILFIVMPIVEMWVLIEVGSRIGALPTIGLVLLTAMVGLALLRQQGFSTLLRANQRLESGELPAQEVAEGLMLAIGGALLLTPGFVTDSIGFACLLPQSRRWMVNSWLKNVQIVNLGGQPRGFGGGPGAGSRPFHDPFNNAGSHDDGGNVYDGEFRRDPDSTDRLP